MERSATQLVLGTSSEVEQWVIVAQNYLPGWKVTVDGREPKPALAESIFFAIPVPPGNHTVKLQFSLFTLLRDSLALLFHPEESIWLQ